MEERKIIRNLFFILLIAFACLVLQGVAKETEAPKMGYQVYNLMNDDSQTLNLGWIEGEPRFLELNGKTYKLEER